MYCGRSATNCDISKKALAVEQAVVGTKREAAKNA
jgi:hypothetical protein